MWNWLGLVVAGVLNGTFAVPMKRTRAWTFHHVWGLFSLLAMVVIPWAGIFLAVSGWRETLAAIPADGLAKLIVLGLVWGEAPLLFGLAVEYLGVALGMSIHLGLSITVGSLLPLVLAKSLGSASAGFVASLLLMVAG